MSLRRSRRQAEAIIADSDSDDSPAPVFVAPLS